MKNRAANSTRTAWKRRSDRTFGLLLLTGGCRKSGNKSSSHLNYVTLREAHQPQVVCDIIYPLNKKLIFLKHENLLHKHEATENLL